MINVSQHAPRSKPEASNHQREELAAHLWRRAAHTLAQLILAGQKSVRADELLWQMRLHRKRRSLQREAVALVMIFLGSRGVLPRDFVVVW